MDTLEAIARLEAQITRLCDTSAASVCPSNGVSWIFSDIYISGNANVEDYPFRKNHGSMISLPRADLYDH